MENIYQDLWEMNFTIDLIYEMVLGIATRRTTIYALFAILLIMGVVIIINQIRLRKQLRQIQEQLSRAEAGGEDLT